MHIIANKIDIERLQAAFPGIITSPISDFNAPELIGTVELPLTAVNMKELFAYVNSCEVSFSGGGDSGEVDSPEINYHPGVPSGVKALIADVASKLTEEAATKQDLDWWNNEGGQGSVTLDPKELTLRVCTEQNEEQSESDQREYKLSGSALAQAKALLTEYPTATRLLMEWSSDDFEAVLVDAHCRNLADLEDSEVSDIYTDVENKLGSGDDYTRYTLVLELETMQAAAESNWYETCVGNCEETEYTFANGDIEHV